MVDIQNGMKIKFRVLEKRGRCLYSCAALLLTSEDRMRLGNGRLLLCSEINIASRCSRCVSSVSLSICKTSLAMLAASVGRGYNAAYFLASYLFVIALAFHYLCRQN